MNTERLFAEFERLSEAPNTPAKLRAFVLDLAVRGRLDTQDASDPHATALLTTIKEEQEPRVNRGTRTRPSSHVTRAMLRLQCRKTGLGRA